MHARICKNIFTANIIIVYKFTTHSYICALSIYTWDFTLLYLDKELYKFKQIVLY